MRLRAAFALASCILLISCGGSSGSSSPTSLTVAAPSAPTPTSPVTPTPTFTVGFTATGSGTYTASLAGQTYTASGNFPVSLAEGSYEISGSFTGNTLGIAFVSIPATNGGVQSGSIQSLVGANAFPAACAIIYTGSGTTTSNAFRVRFSVTTNRNSTCQG